ncbi:hypothetical protein [[Clostridium] scindens]|uniref:hypothetical protein n=1 Tax=Clostridium scindens (strain JCM 10418 / VPI 12708) TaxID=29347 RepID=UPI00243210DC|nr:hypothetical protein [[Clostridium] scindens]
MRVSMRSCGRLRKGLLIMALLLCMTVQTAFAAEGGNEKEYTYTVTLSAGNQGTFNGTGGVHVIGGSAQISGGDAIRITGLRAGDVVVLDATAGMVDLKNGDKYYIKGVRESGRDNNTVADSAFTVTKDAEYVVAYSIQGDMVAYTVNYQDGGGNELAPSRTYYGAVGDKPVIAYQYIEGYRPDAYNLTKTLGKNEADNVFTFTYTQSIVQQPATGGEGTEGGTDAGAPGTPGTPATPGTTAGGAGTAGAGAAAAAGTVETPTAENTDEEVPQGTVDLDDEDTPKANIDASDSDTVRNPSPVPIVLGIMVAVIALGALIGTYVYFKKKHKADS